MSVFVSKWLITVVTIRMDLAAHPDLHVLVEEPVREQWFIKSTVVC